jgi:hypothetical protein
MIINENAIFAIISMFSGVILLLVVHYRNRIHKKEAEIEELSYHYRVTRARNRHLAGKLEEIGKKSDDRSRV